MKCHRCQERILPHQAQVSLEYGEVVVWAYHANKCANDEADILLLNARDYDALWNLQPRHYGRRIETLELPDGAE